MFFIFVASHTQFPYSGFRAREFRFDFFMNYYSCPIIDTAAHTTTQIKSTKTRCYGANKQQLKMTRDDTGKSLGCSRPQRILRTLVMVMIICLTGVLFCEEVEAFSHMRSLSPIGQVSRCLCSVKCRSIFPEA
jgi:hypothetical protein